MNKRKVCNISNDAVGCIFTYNRFEVLNEEAIEQAEEVKVIDGHLKFDVKDLYKLRKDENQGRKRFKPVETFKWFQLFEDNPEEDLNNLVMIVEIKKTPKHQLKKCRKCNYKKRTCALNSSSCQANLKSCYNCGKTGHYPQSKECSRRRKLIKKSQSSSPPKTKVQQPRINKKNVELI